MLVAFNKIFDLQFYEISLEICSRIWVSTLWLKLEYMNLVVQDPCPFLQSRDVFVEGKTLTQCFVRP